MQRNRYLYFTLMVFTTLAGLASRQFAYALPHWVKLYLGDVLWALMVFWFLGFIFRKISPFWIAITALLFSFGIEFSQFYHAAWIDSLRANRLGGLILGYGFLWSDMICYTVGVGLGYLFEFLFLKKTN